MTVVRGFAITIASGLVLGCLGAGVGYLLGSVAPDYYRTVFRIGCGWHAAGLGGAWVVVFDE